MNAHRPFPNLLAIPLAALLLMRWELSAEPDDPVNIPDEALAFFILRQYQHEQHPDPPQSENHITEAHMARLNRFVPSEYTTAPFTATDLTGLEFAVNMERIDLTSSPIGNRFDLAPLAGLPSLKELSLSFADIIDLSVLNSIPNLEILGLANCGISNLPRLSVRLRDY